MSQSQYSTTDGDTFAADTYYTDPQGGGGRGEGGEDQYTEGGEEDTTYYEDGTQYTGQEDQTYGDEDQTYDEDATHDQEEGDEDDEDDDEEGEGEEGYDDEYDDEDEGDEEEEPAPYADQPYDANLDTGQGMMAYDERIEDEPEYDYDPDEDYDDFESEQEPMMPGDYYAGDEPEEEYYDEDEEERRRRARRRRAWCCCLILLCCLLILIILLIVFLLTMKDNDTVEDTPAPTFAPFVDETDDDYYYDDDIILAPGVTTTEMAPVDNNCDFDDQPGFANVWDQCNCDGEITVIPDDVGQMRQLIIDRMFFKFYDADHTLPANSCDPANMALIWLAAGDNRDAGEPRQRFALATSYFGLNGTIWDYDDEWLGELNECLWLGVQCNNRDTVNSFALDTNNIFGLVRTELCATLLYSYCTVIMWMIVMLLMVGGIFSGTCQTYNSHLPCYRFDSLIPTFYYRFLRKSLPWMVWLPFPFLVPT